ncbi:uncharacterized protein LOC135940262 [Cloeon dipterum]|uniref:uncharacterized protein LOC135940262 n=1 Tax=Cloeon dipterum TaxID=197152 RepID=UPI0032205811
MPLAYSSVSYDTRDDSVSLIIDPKDKYYTRFPYILYNPVNWEDSLEAVEMTTIEESTETENLEAVETAAVEERTDFENDSECDQLSTTEATFENTHDLHSNHALILPMVNPDRGLDVLIVDFSAKELFTADALLNFFHATGSIRSVIGKRSANARIAPQERNDLKAPLPPVDEK